MGIEDTRYKIVVPIMLGRGAEAEYKTTSCDKKGTDILSVSE